MREVFVSAVKSCNVKVYRCFFEADNEIGEFDSFPRLIPFPDDSDLSAILARKLNCPVLSYDSDFYIFDGQYIPYVTITPKVYKKTVTSSKSFEVEVVQKKQKGQKNVRRKVKKIIVETADENSEEVQETTYNYLDCCMYRIENLTDGVLDNDMLPLFAIMLGNDFISRKWFAKFFRNVNKRTTKKKKNLSPQQKKIYTLLNWLQHETLRSAIKKILDCVKHYQRPKLWYQIRSAMRGYRMVHSKSFEYFGFEEQPVEEEESGVLDMNLDELMVSDEECESEVDVDEEPPESDGEEEEEQVEVEADPTSDVEDENQEDVNGFEVKNSDDEDFEDPNEGQLSDEDEVPEAVRRRRFVFPEWFQKIYNAGSTPRFLVDVLRCRRYINYPQVEDFSGPDSNAISYHILNLLYSLLHSPDVPPMFYYTRVPKQVRYEVKKIEPHIFPTVTDFDPSEKKNFRFMKMIFERDFKNSEEIFESIKEIPEAHQLYILAVIFWLKRSSTTNSHFLQTSIIGLIAISIVDKKCEKIHRDGSKFLKNFDKHLKELKAKEVPVTSDDLPLRSVIKNVTKHEALLAMENLISYYSISPKFERKHADFRRNIVHTFSELQSVAFNLYSISPFLNYPFDNIRIENYFNGLFLYNMYINLKSRSNSLDYIKNYIFNHSPSIMTIFNRIYKICAAALPDLKIEASETLDAPRKTRAAKNKIKKVSPPVKTENDCVDEASDSDKEFEDLNNKFCQLMRNAN